MDEDKNTNDLAWSGSKSFPTPCDKMVRGVEDKLTYDPNTCTENGHQWIVMHGGKRRMCLTCNTETFVPRKTRGD